MSETARADTHARITPEKVAEAKARIGMVSFKRLPWGPFNREAHPDTIRHYAFGIGDNNPLWCEPDYAAKSRWGSVIGPPLYLQTVAFEESAPESQRVPKGDPLRGLHAFFSAVDWEFYLPVKPGDSLSSLHTLESVQEKRSSFGGGQSVVMTYQRRYRNQRGEAVGVSHESYVHTEREGAQKAGKDAAIQRQVYTPEQMAEIEAAYDAETRRGAEPRYWEDVSVGDVVPQIVKGPFTLVELLGNAVGSSFGAFGVTPHRLGYVNRKRVPGFYFLDQYGVPISAWACHYDDAVARRAGAPIPYDFGLMRESWLYNLLTNWMGDDAFLARAHVEFRRFNYMGDTQWCRATVSGKSVEDGRHTVTVDMHCENQRGVVTTTGNATILLPSRDAGPVRLPDQPTDLR